MADVIDTCMKQRVVTEFLTSEEVSPTEIHSHLNSVYGEHIVDMNTERDFGSSMLRVVKRRSETLPEASEHFVDFLDKVSQSNLSGTRKLQTATTHP
jgi:DNA-binding transcriptional ArsR family regulator